MAHFLSFLISFSKKKAWRIRTIYQTNIRTSYAAGRYKQLKESGVKFWIYRHNENVVRPRQHHLELDGLCLPADDPFWQTNYPPNGWGCRCYVVGTMKQRGNIAAMKKRAATAHKPDEGWAYAPGRSVFETYGSFVGRKLIGENPLYLATLGERLFKRFVERKAPMITLSETDLAAIAKSAVGKEVAELTDDFGKKPRVKKAVFAGALPPDVVDFCKKQGVDLSSGAILMTDFRLAHALRQAKEVEGKTLPKSVFKNLLSNLYGANIYWDKEKNNLVYVFKVNDAKGSVVKIIVAKERREKIAIHGKSKMITSNFVVTGGIVEDPNIFTNTKLFTKIR